MTTEIDPLVFRDNDPIDKSDLREQFQIAGEEITALQEKVSVPYRAAFNDLDFDYL
jgi:hypothetical protein